MDFDKKTALMHAVEYGSAEVVRQLLGAGASVNLKSGYGQAPLHIASMKIWPSVEIIDLLLAEGANRNAKDAAGRIALDLAMDEDVIRVLKLPLWGRFKAWLAS
jgi:ankyrin repeat protein